MKLLSTKNVEYDPSAPFDSAQGRSSEQVKKFHLLCDNPNCPDVGRARMVTKEGDELGIEPIKARLEKDEMLIKQALSLQGVLRVLLRNSIPVSETKDAADDYEITPEYVYTFNEAENKVETSEKPWEVKDDQGVLSNSLMPPPIVVSLIKQLVKALGI